MAITIDKRSIADLVREQFPDFYRQEGENFVAFVEAYQEFLDKEQLSYKLAQYGDIDTTLNSFLASFRAEFLPLIPARIAGDQRMLIKHVLDLYRAKGSKQGYKLLFRLLFNDDIELYVPGDDMLAPSDGDWYEPYYLEVTPSEYNKTFIGKKIVGAGSGAEAVVETYIRQPVNGKMVDILYISSKIGDFEVGEKIMNEEDFSSVNVVDAPSILGSLASVSFIQGGQGFTVGQRMKLITGKGVEGEVRISNTANGTGTLQFTVVNGGTLYSMDAKEIITRTEPANAVIRGTGASFDIGAITDVQEIQYDSRFISELDSLLIANTTVNKVQVVAGGTGYSNAGVVTFTNDRGVQSIVVNTGGTGYLDTDTVVITGTGTGVNAVLRTYSNGTVKSIDIFNTGKGFTADPTVTITSNTGTGVSLTAVRTGATGSGATGTVNTYGNGTIQSITVTAGGSGYQMPPLVTVSGGSGASLTSNIYSTDYGINQLYSVDANTPISNGSIISSKFFGTIASLTNIATGNNYQSAPNVAVYDFAESAVLTGNVFFSANSLEVTGVGTSFLSNFDANTANTAIAKNVVKLIATPVGESNVEYRIVKTVSNNTHMILDDFPQYTANGQLSLVGISSGGSGYQNTDTVVVSGSGGSGANVAIQTDNSGTIISVDIISRGAGWRANPTVSVTSNTGTGAVLTSAIVVGAHRLAMNLLEINYAPYELEQPDGSISGKNAVITGSPVFGAGIIRLGQVKNSGFGYEEDEIVELSAFGGIASTTIKSGGRLYQNNDPLVVTGGGGGFGAKGFVTTNANGTVTSVTLTSPGSGYTVPPSIRVRSTTGSGAAILCEVGGLNNDFFVNGIVHKEGQGRLQGQWLTTKGFLNADKYIQDSYYYQEYSYELRTGMNLNEYASLVKRIFHPAGNELFGAVVISDEIDNTLTEESVSVTG
jgi:hypothetical protein